MTGFLVGTAGGMLRRMRGGSVAVAALLAVVGAACSGSHPTHPASATATATTSQGRLQLQLGPGAPNAPAPRVIHLVVSGPKHVTVDTHLGQQVSLLLPPGAYTVKSRDGKACVTGIVVVAGATVSDGLAYPFKGCQHLTP